MIFCKMAKFIIHDFEYIDSMNICKLNIIYIYF